ncbi:MAG TPA: FAD-dependent oxidoreductase, partial [Saprospiraceae bacterium]|nr:FAD-dependent oxidoreductase [Saprospiraceae bacterium]
MEIVIIVNGISGITCARHIRKLSNHSVTVISAESNYFFSRTALMYVYMGHMKWSDIEPYESWFWDKNNIKLITEVVESVDFDKKQVILSSKGFINYDKLVIATGSSSNKFDWPGQDLQGVTGLYNKQDLEMMELFSKDLNRAVIVGGGLIGIEMAEMFHSRNIPVTLTVREQGYWSNILPIEESEMV